MKTRDAHAEVAVVGAGPVGALLALRLAREGRQVAVLEARARHGVPRDARALALSSASLSMLEDVCPLPPGAVTAIDRVHVSQQGFAGRTRIDGEDLGLAHLGAVVDYPVLVAALEAALEEAGVAVQYGCRVEGIDTLSRYARLRLEDGGTLTARLAVLADGGPLAETLPCVVRRAHDYGQCALIAGVKFEQSPAGVAFERFAAAGPFALLPHGDGFVLVWTRSPADAERLSADPLALAAELQQAFGGRLGRVREVGGTARFPLVLRQLNRVVSRRAVMIGNAAQTMHPVAAQGLNLGLRDAATLAGLLSGAADPGEAALLSRYAAARRVDSHAVVGFTHSLVRVFDGAGAPVSLARGTAMTLIDALPGLRRRFAGHLVFGV